jgi:hypothetical protein
VEDNVVYNCLFLNNERIKVELNYIDSNDSKLLYTIDNQEKIFILK